MESQNQQPTAAPKSSPPSNLQSDSDIPKIDLPDPMKPVDINTLVDSDEAPATYPGRICQDCNQYLPLQAFGNRKDGRCMACSNKRKIEAFTERTRQNALEMMQTLAISTEMGGGAQVPSTPELMRKVVSVFGGADKMVLYWKDCLDQLVEKKGMSVGVLQHLAQMFKMIAESNKQAHVEQVDKMSLEQIEREQKRLLIEMLMEKSQGAQKEELIDQILQSAGILQKDLEPVLVEATVVEK